MFIVLTMPMAWLLTYRIKRLLLLLYTWKFHKNYCFFIFKTSGYNVDLMDCVSGQTDLCKKEGGSAQHCS